MFLPGVDDRLHRNAADVLPAGRLHDDAHHSRQTKRTAGLAALPCLFFTFILFEVRHEDGEPEKCT